MSDDATERYYADMEHARNVHQHEFFKARPHIDQDERAVSLFRAGFERAFKFLWQRMVDAEADALRLHQQYVDSICPGSSTDQTAPEHE